MKNTNSENGFKAIAAALIKFSIPLMLGGILQQLYSWADAFIVGNTEGAAALAAVGAASAAVNFYLTVLTGFTLGIAILAAQKQGTGDISPVGSLLCIFGVFLGAVFLLLSALGMIFARPLLVLLNTTPDTLDMAETYLRTVLAGIPFLAVYNVFSAVLRGIGDSKTPFYAVLISSAANILLDVVLVVLLRQSVAGAAAATVVSQAAMTVFIVLHSLKKHGFMRRAFKRSSLQRELFLHGCRFGVPPMLQSGVSSAGSLILQGFMNSFGTQTVAAITTAYRIDLIIMVPLINLGSGISTFTAQACGSGDIKRAKKSFAAGSAVMLIISLMLTAIVIPTGGSLIAAFGAGSEASAIGSAFFARIALFYPVYGLATALRSYIEGRGDVVYSSASGIISLICRIIASYAMAPLFDNMTVAYAEALSWVVLLILLAARAAVRQVKD